VVQGPEDGDLLFKEKGEASGATVYYRAREEGDGRESEI
jgi:hypothetical protein